MPQKVIAIFGSPGSGKSTLSLMMGYALAAKKKNVVLVSIDRTVPQAKVLLPSSEGRPEQSLGAMFMDSLSEQTVLRSLLYHPECERLGLLSFQSGDTETRYAANLSKDRYRDIMNTLYRFVDHIIIDCTANPITNALTPASLELADRIVALYTPDHGALEWRKSVYALLRDNRFRAEEHFKVLSLCHPYSPAELIAKELEASLILPYAQEVYESRLSGTLFTVTKAETRLGYQYAQEIEKIVKEVTAGAGN